MRADTVDPVILVGKYILLDKMHPNNMPLSLGPANQCTSAYPLLSLKIKSNKILCISLYVFLSGPCHSSYFTCSSLFPFRSRLFLGFSAADGTPSSPQYLPTSQNAACSCNLVAYNLMATCGWCQNVIQTPWWATWAGNCSHWGQHTIPPDCQLPSPPRRSRFRHGCFLSSTRIHGIRLPPASWLTSVATGTNVGGTGHYARDWEPSAHIQLQRQPV